VVTGIEGNKAYIIGKVTRPGPILLNSPTYVLQALSMAGVLDRFADKSAIKLIRITEKGQEVISLNYENLIRGKNLESNILLKSGDTIVVP
jgi:polysaccharide export outer membrane protein